MGYQIKGLDEKTCSTSRYLPKYEPSRNGQGKSDFLPPSFPLPALTPLLWDDQGRGKEGVDFGVAVSFVECVSRRRKKNGYTTQCRKPKCRKSNV